MGLLAAYPRVPRPKPIRYYGKCLRTDGTEILLVTRAFSEAEACKQLHKYNIVMVVDLLSSEDADDARISRSLTGSPRLL